MIRIGGVARERLCKERIRCNFSWNQVKRGAHNQEVILIERKRTDAKPVIESINKLTHAHKLRERNNTKAH